MNRSISIFRKIALAYSEVCKPLCKELGLPQTAFDILMFLGNNPAYKTASEIVEIRRLKANLVSVNVEKLVQEGYLTRCAVQSLVCGAMIGMICGFIGAGGGMMMLLILTSVMGYELKTAVGTSVFIMTFTALTGAVSHFAIGGLPDTLTWALCVVFTLLWARIAAVFANRAQPKTLNRATGVVLVVLGIAVMGFQLLA